MREENTEILIVGGGMGGVAAAIAACRAGRKVILTEETDWLGGQATGQGVPLDEHPNIERFGATASYHEFRNRIRQFYRNNYMLTMRAREDRYLNPGACWVSTLGFEPRVGMLALEEMLMPYRTAGLLRVWMNTKPTHVHTHGDKIIGIEFFDHVRQKAKTVTAEYYLDATELGDLLELGNVEHVVGAESQRETGEPLAVDEPMPLRQQPFTHIVAVEYHPDEPDEIIEKPTMYSAFREKFDSLTGECDSLRDGSVIKSGIPRGLFVRECGNQYEPSMWNFRRYFCRSNFDTSFYLSDITALMVGNEYSEGVLCGVSEEEVQRNLNAARQLSLSLVYYLQTEAPFRGGNGIHGLRVSQSTFDTEDGLAKYPYIRESRRIRAEFMIREQDFLVSEHPDLPVRYHDSVGLGGYRIDIHEKMKGQNKSITTASHGKHWAQQIPLGALIPVRMENLIAAGKNLGTTHVTNGAYRLHPVEWNIGEAAGALAAYCVRVRETPRGVRNTDVHLADFQAELMRRGVELEWSTYPIGKSYYSRYQLEPNWSFGESFHNQ